MQNLRRAKEWGKSGLDFLFCHKARSQYFARSPLPAVRTRHHDPAHPLREDDKVAAEDAGHSVSEHSPIIEKDVALEFVLVLFCLLV